MRRLYLDVETLKKLYYQERMTPLKIAGQLDCSEGAVMNEMHRQGFIFRNRKEAHCDYSGSKNPAWKGGRWKAKDGYIMISIGNKKHRHEHIVVWEKTYAKTLPKGWVVHHLNGIRDDNRAENLFAMPRAGHTKLEMSEVYKKRIRQLEKELKDVRNGIQPLSFSVV